MKYLFAPVLSILLIISPVYAVEKASEERLDEIVGRSRYRGEKEQASSLKIK